MPSHNMVEVPCRFFSLINLHAQAEAIGQEHTLSGIFRAWLSLQDHRVHTFVTNLTARDRRDVRRQWAQQHRLYFDSGELVLTAMWTSRTRWAARTPHEPDQQPPKRIRDKRSRASSPVNVNPPDYSTLGLFRGYDIMRPRTDSDVQARTPSQERRAAQAQNCRSTAVELLDIADELDQLDTTA